MKLSVFLLVLSLYSAYAVNAATASIIEIDNPESADLPKEERPRMSIVTPAVLVLSSIAVVGCFVWVNKYCAEKLYKFIVRPNWSMDDWHDYRNFMRWKIGGRFSDFFDRSTADFHDFYYDFSRKHRSSRSSENVGGTRGDYQYDNSRYDDYWDDIFGDIFEDAKRKRGQYSYSQEGQRSRNQHHGYKQYQASKSPYTKDPWEVLGLSRDASEEEIKKKFWQLARQYHPDKNPGDPSVADKFKEIAAAYEKLTKNRG